MISYSLKENGIFWVIIEGDTSFDDIKNYLEDFKSFDFLSQELRLFYDLRNANLKVTGEDIANISILAAQSTINYESIRTAFVVKEIHATAYAYLFAEQPGNIKGIRRVFSTEEGAIQWLNSELEG